MSFCIWDGEHFIPQRDWSMFQEMQTEMEQKQEQEASICFRMAEK